MKSKIIIATMLIILFCNDKVNAKEFSEINCEIKKGINYIIENNNDLDISVCNVETINSKVKLDKEYNSYAVITMNVLNTSLEEIELSNVNTYAYQNNKSIPTFVKSEKDECLGFVGCLSSGESKIVKMCVGLLKSNSNIKLVFEDSRITVNNIWKKEIDI